MSTTMEFWGVEVKSGQSLKINPGDERVLHLSQASLGEFKKDKESEPVSLYVKVDDKKLVLGTLSHEKFPQWSLDLVIEKDFELSHNWKNGSVYFIGYKLSVQEEFDTENYTEDAKEISLVNNGTHQPQAKLVSDKAKSTKPTPSVAKQKDVKPSQEADDSDSDSSDSSDDDETSDDEDPKPVNGKSENGKSSSESDEDSDEDSDESESEDEEEETPKKAESSKKRPAASATQTSGPDKKAKFITPQKTEGKKGVVHIATPHPAAKKAPTNSDQTKQQAQKSGGTFPCKSCNRSFTSEVGLQSHTKAKHSAAA